MRARYNLLGVCTDESLLENDEACSSFGLAATDPKFT